MQLIKLCHLLWNLVPNSIHVMWNATGRAIFSVNLRKSSKSSDPFAIDFGHIDLSNCNLFVPIGNHLKSKEMQRRLKLKLRIGIVNITVYGCL